MTQNHQTSPIPQISSCSRLFCHFLRQECSKGQVSLDMLLTWEMLSGVWSNFCKKNLSLNLKQKKCELCQQFSFLDKNWTKHQGAFPSLSISYLKRHDL